jgi:glutamate/tyrosine decarboxylase-like PLP-dependent enzyme
MPGPIEQLRKHPAVRAGTTLAAGYGLYKLYETLSLQWGESTRDMLSRVALLLPPAREAYRQNFTKDVKASAKSHAEGWKKFGTPMTAIPEDGWTAEGVMGLIDQYCAVTNPPLEEKCMSGTIYSNSFRDEKAKATQGNQELIGKQKPRDLSSPEALSVLAAELEESLTYSFRKSMLWNSLHGNEFGIGDFVTYQVVHMVGNMYGADPARLMGFVTSGGTESLMLAMRCYRQWGISNRNHGPGDAVVIAPSSVHAAVNKAGTAYHMTVVMTPTNAEGRVDLAAMRRALKKYGKRVVCVVGSTPSYPTGVVDDIPSIAKMAREHGCGMHVDGCLGGFIVNYAGGHNTDFLALEGVTSMSVDTHKNGWAPKGSSCCLMNPLPDKNMGPDTNLAYHSIYSMPGWSGGVYGTPRDPGSQQVSSALQALVAMLSIGKSGYRQIAQGVHQASKDMAAVISEFPELELVCAPEVNVVTWQIAKKANWPGGAIYGFAKEMDERGFTVSAIKDEMVHFCATGRVAFNSQLAQVDFRTAIQQSLDVLKEQVSLVHAGKAAFRGDAGMYGQLQDAMAPEAGSMSTAKYLENYVLGNRGANDAVKAHFMGNFSPYANGGRK